MNLVLSGPPGAGKGTQAPRLSREFNLRHLSSGDVLRAERERGTPLGRQVGSFIDAGVLVPDNMVTEVVLAHLPEPDEAAGFILDGFPRTQAQAEQLDQALERAGRRLNLVLALKVSDDEIVDRISGRRVCPVCGRVYHVRYRPPVNDLRCDDDGALLIHRTDDEPQVVLQRVRTYHQRSEPVEAYYRRKRLLVNVDAGRGADEVFAELCRVIRERQELPDS